MHLFIYILIDSHIIYQINHDTVMYDNGSESYEILMAKTLLQWKLSKNEESTYAFVLLKVYHLKSGCLLCARK